jgi:hypothetical protein
VHDDAGFSQGVSGNLQAFPADHITDHPITEGLCEANFTLGFLTWIPHRFPGHGVRLDQEEIGRPVES